MPQFSRTRISLTRALAASALTVAVGGSLVACGSDDSTVSATPEPSSSETSEAPAPTSKDAEAPADGEDSAPAPVTSPSEAATAPPETPEPVPSDYPGPAKPPPVSEEGQRFLAELEKKGITPAADGAMALSTADYICQAKEAGKSDADIMVFVTAMVGSEASAAGRDISTPEATATAKTYLDTATAVYC